LAREKRERSIWHSEGAYPSKVIKRRKGKKNYRYALEGSRTFALDDGSTSISVENVKTRKREG